MRKSKYSEHQIIAILKAVEAGRTVKEVCREHEISDATYYQWKSKYGGMQASDIKRLYREAVLDRFVFQSLSEVREQTALWLKEYNEERPHKSLGHLTPREYLLTQKPEISSNSWV